MLFQGGNEFENHYERSRNLSVQNIEYQHWPLPLRLRVVYQRIYVLIFLYYFRHDNRLQIPSLYFLHKG